MSQVPVKDGGYGQGKIGGSDTAAVFFGFRGAINVGLAILALVLLGFGGCFFEKQDEEEILGDIGAVDLTVSEPEEVAVRGDTSEEQSLTFGEVTVSETNEIAVGGESSEKKCVLFGHPGDERNPEDDCWDPPEHYCSVPAGQLLTVACTPDGSLCCLFDSTCVPCGWLTSSDGCSFCLVKDNDEGFEYKFCGDEDSPCKSYGPVTGSYGEGPDPRCPVIDWDLEICLEYQ